MKKAFCHKGHDISVFGRNSHGACKECHRAISRAYYHKKRWDAGYKPRVPVTHCPQGHELKIYGRNRRRCAECHREESRKRQALHPEKGWAANIKRWYGITPEFYMEMFSKQDGRCAICKREPSEQLRGGKEERLAVDHDHITGRVRGLLCWPCNTALGRVEPFISGVVAYLNAH